MKYVMSIIVTVILSLPLYAEMSSGIAVYTRVGCSRCADTINYLKTHNISYVEYPIEDETNYNSLCEIISRSGKENNGFIRTPVIVKDGEVYFNIENLETFLESLEK